MSDQSAIVNKALAIFGLEAMANPAAPADKLERALVADADDARRQVLQKQKWTAATRCGMVNADPAVPAPAGYDKAGPLPADWLAMWDVSTCDHWEVAAGAGPEARRVLFWRGPDAVKILYAGDVPYALLDPLLQRACAARLAANCANVKAERASDLEIYAKLALRHEGEAAVRDEFNRRAHPLLQSNWMDADVRASGWLA